MRGAAVCLLFSAEAAFGQTVNTPFGMVSYCYSLTIAQDEYLLGWYEIDHYFTPAERANRRWADPKRQSIFEKLTKPNEIAETRKAIDQEVEMIGQNLESAYRMMLTQDGKRYAVRPNYAFGCTTGNLY